MRRGWGRTDLGTLVRANSSLRLAPGAARDGSRQRREVSRAVGHENRAAAGLSPTDARWALAARTAQLIQGGRAAILTPECRARLLGIGTRMGLRPFDTNLVIAIVQDGARCGEPLGEASEERLALVRPVPDASARAGWWTLLAAIMLGSAFFWIAVRWLTGA